jgi:hypothetical protein
MKGGANFKNGDEVTVNSTINGQSHACKGKISGDWTPEYVRNKSDTFDEKKRWTVERDVFKFELRHGEEGQRQEKYPRCILDSKFKKGDAVEVERRLDNGSGDPKISAHAHGKDKWELQMTRFGQRRKNPSLYYSWVGSFLEDKIKPTDSKVEADYPVFPEVNPVVKSVWRPSTERKCPEGHPLIKNTYRGVPWRCDVCGKQYSQTKSSWNCDRCDYDVCNDCMGINKSSNPVKPVLTPPGRITQEMLDSFRDNIPEIFSSLREIFTRATIENGVNILLPQTSWGAKSREFKLDLIAEYEQLMGSAYLTNLRQPGSGEFKKFPIYGRNAMPSLEKQVNNFLQAQMRRGGGRMRRVGDYLKILRQYHSSIEGPLSRMGGDARINIRQFLDLGFGRYLKTPDFRRAFRTYFHHDYKFYDNSNDFSESTTVTTGQIALPAGWSELYSQPHRRRYYCNEATGESSWTRPSNNFFRSRPIAPPPTETASNIGFPQSFQLSVYMGEPDLGLYIQKLNFKINCPPVHVENFRNSGRSLVLKNPMYLCNNVETPPRNGKLRGGSNPVLLVAADDWPLLRADWVTHKGSFGSDSMELSPGIHDNSLSATTLHDSEWLKKRRWVAVWKFPADIYNIPGFKVVERCPVGKYNSTPDPWAPFWITENEYIDIPATKIRVDIRTKYDSLAHFHFLEYSDGMAIPAISTQYWADDLWEMEDHEQESIIKFMRDMSDEFGIKMFPCYGQHHLLVFYLDSRGDYTYGRGPRIMKISNMVKLCKKERFLNLLQRSCLPKKKETVKTWCNYYHTFVKKEKERAHAAQRYTGAEP